MSDIDLARWVSDARLGEYSLAANRDPDATRELYQWNASVSASFFELISYVEIGLRNAIDRVMTPLEPQIRARVSNDRGWWFASPAFLRDEELKYASTAKSHLGADWKRRGRDKVFATMTFGLWSDLFTKHYDSLFRSVLVDAFTNPPAGFDRKRVMHSVQGVRELRNRIAHHQPIFDSPLQERFEQALEILEWIDQDLGAWVSGLESTHKLAGLLASRPIVATPIAVIVPAKEAWPFYLKNSAYVCQPGRTFKSVSHMGFYFDGSIQRELPAIEYQVDDMPWTPSTIADLYRQGDSRSQRLAKVITAARAAGWDGDRYQVFLLTDPGAGSPSSHRQLRQTLPNTRHGRGSAWVQRQRYVALDRLLGATSLGELDQQ